MFPSNRDMLSDFSVRGTWWLTPNSQDQVSGTLRFSNDRIELQLDRAFFDGGLASAWGIGGFRADVILGQTTDNQRCSLHGVFFRGWSGQEPILVVQHLLFGAHITQNETLPDRKALVEYTGLEEWAAQHFVEERTDEATGKQVFSVSLFREVSLSIPGNPPLKQLELHTSAHSHSERTKTTLTYKSEFVVTFGCSVSVAQVVDCIRKISNLLALLMGVPVYPRTIRLMSATEHGSAQPPIDLLLALRAGPVRKKSSFEMILPLNALGPSRANQLFERWFSSDDLLRPVCDLLLSTVYNPSLYVQSTFLTLTQAIESFHRRVHGGVYVSKEEYDLLKRSLADAIPIDTDDDLKAKLTVTLEYANEFSLPKRLKNLFATIDHEHLIGILGSEDVKEFIRLIVDVRNYLTHYDESKRRSVLSSLPAMYNLNQRLKTILVLLVLKHVGVEENYVFLPLKGQMGLTQ